MTSRIIDTVDDHFCGYLWHFSAVCLHAWRRACWLQADTWNSTNCMLTWAKVAWDWWLLNLVHNAGQTGHFYTHRARFHVSSTRMWSTGKWLHSGFLQEWYAWSEFPLEQIPAKTIKYLNVFVVVVCFDGLMHAVMPQNPNHFWMSSRAKLCEHCSGNAT